VHDAVLSLEQSLMVLSFMLLYWILF